MKPSFRCANSIVIILFLIAITGPLLASLLYDDLQQSAAEKRVLAQIPSLPRSHKDLNKLPRICEDYYNDHFGFRETLVEWGSMIKFRLGGDPSAEAVIGKDEWLYYANKEQRSIEDYRNCDPLSASQLEAWRDDLVAKHGWLKKRGIPYVFIIAPNKHTIYPEYMPGRFKRLDAPSRCDQFVAYMRAHTEVPILDLRPPLLEAKKQDIVYCRLDTHWNDLGANSAQYEIAHYLKTLFSEIQPHLFSPEDFVWYEGAGGDLAGMLGLGKTLKELRPVFRKPQHIFFPDEAGIKHCVTTCETAEHTAVMVMDSFSLNVTPLFSDYFGKTVYLWLKPNLSWIMKYVDQYEPDIVLEERAERLLSMLPPPDFLNHQEMYEQQFERSAVTIFRLAQETRLDSHGLQRINESNSDNGADFTFDVLGTDPQIEFQGLPFERAKEYVVKVSITSPGPTVLQVFYSIKDGRGYRYKEEQRVSVTLHSGLNTVYACLDHRNLGSFLRIDPCATPGRYSLHEVAIREVPLGGAF